MAPEVAGGPSILGQRREGRSMHVCRGSERRTTAPQRQHAGEPTATPDRDDLERPLPERPPRCREPTGARERNDSGPLREIVPFGGEGRDVAVNFPYQRIRRGL